MIEENEYKTAELLGMPPYEQSAETDAMFMEALQEELQFHYDHNEAYRQFCERKGFNPHEPLTDIRQIPPVAVSVFKELGFSLASVPKEDIRLRLQSSATSGTPSTIVVDKETSRRQAKAMVKVMQEVIGRERKPFLVMDIDPRSEFKALLGARFAAITGYLNFASKAAYFLKANEKRVSYFDVEAMQEYLHSLLEEQPVVVFGFTYILYSQVLKALQAADVQLHLPKGSKIIHIGGWKKLESEKVEKRLFNQQLSESFGIEPTDVVDIYGFTEQMGLNYPDCPCGCKHTSNYVRVLVRDAQTREVLPAGQEGMLEFITPVPHSYPGNAVLTDDLGYVIDEPCPCGRGGTRFVVTGRLKKAEIRGCGDILANKLTFSSPTVNGERLAVSGALDVQSYHGESLQATEAKEQLKEIIGSLRDAQKWLREQPVDGLIGLIDLAAKRWLAEPKYQVLKDKGLLFLSTWCAENNLRKVAQLGLRGNVGYADGWLAMPDSEKHMMRANARGLVCHWLAGNVQILGLFALVQAILTKNCNLLKVSKNDEGVFRLLLTAFEGLMYACADGRVIKGDDLLRTIAVVYFPRTADEVAREMSASADVRIAWGGREAVETVAGYPSRYDAETVIFGPKLSMALIAREDLQDEQEARKLARRVAVDVSIFDQTGCASPHNVYVERNGVVSPEQFCELLTEAMRKTELQIPKPAMSAEQVSAIHSIRSVYDFCGKVYGSETMSYTILLDEDLKAHKPVYSRVIFVHVVDDINDALAFVNEDIQTIGISNASERMQLFASSAAVRGAMRFPLIGRMLNFEMPWDGIILIDRLVKWNTLAGPMC